MLNGIEVDAANYTVTGEEGGPTVITLSKSYLKTLANGDYTFRALFSDGYADINLKVAVSSGGGGTPDTGDANLPAVPLTATLLFLGGALVLAGLRLRRQKA